MVPLWMLTYCQSITKFIKDDTTIQMINKTGTTSLFKTYKRSQLSTKYLLCHTIRRCHWLGVTDYLLNPPAALLLVSRAGVTFGVSSLCGVLALLPSGLFMLRPNFCWFFFHASAPFWLPTSRLVFSNLDPFIIPHLHLVSLRRCFPLCLGVCHAPSLAETNCVTEL